MHDTGPCNKAIATYAEGTERDPGNKELEEGSHRAVEALMKSPEALEYFRVNNYPEAARFCERFV